MKLIGSLAESQYKAELISSRDAIFSENKSPALLDVLREHFPEIKSALVLYWIPEQGEDIYDILLDERSIAIVEVARDKKHGSVKVIPLEEYSARIKSKQRRIKMAVALELLKFPSLGEGLIKSDDDAVER